MIELSDKWIDFILSQGETGMGYHIISVVLCNGKRYDRVVVDGGYITRVKGYDTIPFAEEDIREVIVTHDKWDFDKEGK
jgi:hypothetical protein